jgi:hypothetical protein
VGVNPVPSGENYGGRARQRKNATLETAVVPGQYGTSALLAELADAPDLGSGAARCKGSIPLERTVLRTTPPQSGGMRATGRSTLGVSFNGRTGDFESPNPGSIPGAPTMISLELATALFQNLDERFSPRRGIVKKRVYLAGGSDERLTVVRPYIERATAAGIEVTFDWTRSPGYDRESTVTERAKWASLDLEAVRSADIVWVLCPDAKSEGCSAELGAALALGKRVLVSGPHARRESRLFNLLASFYGSPENAFGALVEMCGAGT